LDSCVVLLYFCLVLCFVPCFVLLYFPFYCNTFTMKPQGTAVTRQQVCCKLCCHRWGILQSGIFVFCFSIKTIGSLSSGSSLCSHTLHATTLYRINMARRKKRVPLLERTALR
jgi:hypothetical protein